MAPGRAVKVGLLVSNVPRSVEFYRGALELRWVPELWSFQIGEYPSDGFFLISLEAAQSGGERPVGCGHVGLTVQAVEAAHRRALAAGATEWYPPQDNPGAPRSSGVHDPDGNRIELFEG